MGDPTLQTHKGYALVMPKANEPVVAFAPNQPALMPAFGKLEASQVTATDPEILRSALGILTTAPRNLESFAPPHAGASPDAAPAPVKAVADYRREHFSNLAEKGNAASLDELLQVAINHKLSVDVRQDAIEYLNLGSRELPPRLQEKAVHVLRSVVGDSAQPLEVRNACARNLLGGYFYSLSPAERSRFQEIVRGDTPAQASSQAEDLETLRANCVALAGVGGASAALDALTQKGVSPSLKSSLASAMSDIVQPKDLFAVLQVLEVEAPLVPREAPADPQKEKDSWNQEQCVSELTKSLPAPLSADASERLFSALTSTTNEKVRENMLRVLLHTSADMPEMAKRLSADGRLSASEKDLVELFARSRRNQLSPTSSSTGAVLGRDPIGILVQSSELSRTSSENVLAIRSRTPEEIFQYANQEPDTSRNKYFALACADNVKARGEVIGALSNEEPRIRSAARQGLATLRLGGEEGRKAIEALADPSLAKQIDETHRAQAKAYAQAAQKCEAFGTKEWWRLEPTVLQELAKAHEADRAGLGLEQKTAVVIAARGDHNGAFVRLDELVSSFQKAGQRVLYWDVESDQQAFDILAQRAKEGRPAGVIVFAGHGTQKTLAFSENYYDASGNSNQQAFLDVNDTGAMRRQGVACALKDGGQVVLFACSAGCGGAEADNVANAMREVFPQAKIGGIHSATAPSNRERYLFDDSGNLSSVLFSVEGYQG